MNKSIWRRAGLSLTAVAVIAGVSACGGDDKKNGAETKLQSGAELTKVLKASYKKTEEAKSAKVEMVANMPKSAAFDGGGEMKLSGVMGWDPMVMDMTMSGGALKDTPGAPEQTRMMWINNIMYMDAGAELAKQMDGKRWMKMDLGAVAKESGDAALQKQMTGGLDNMDQNPAEQIAMLLESKSIKHVGAVKMNGVDTQHYKGTISIEEMVAKNDSLVLEKNERAQLIKGMKNTGVTGYNTQIWVNKDGLPVRTDVSMSTKEGPISMVANYSDYGAKATVTPPPANQTFDFAQVLKEAAEAMKAMKEAGTTP
ncbi:hypothetical protein [Streptomyces qinzhouensis]|uniref:Lipoprotein n=1 Tax=Streptomyces qinzhouensis TaxID=2599401 RepID=A0A5B8JL50_9ACTN|nr:hypothetical protein [Streptomyces qinzhouensis]QDY78490.1 hypothetical protein FQU76_20535 [Streptomyces qinzhouensis]